MALSLLFSPRWTLTATVERRTQGVTFVDGLPVDAASETLTMHVNRQSLEQKDMDQGFSGRRKKDLFKIYTKDPIYTSDEKEGHQADILTIEGEAFEVLQVDPYNQAHGYYMAIIARDNES